MEISINIDGIFQDLITDNGNHFSSTKGLFVAGKYECESAIDTSSLFFHLATPQTTEKPSDIDMNHSV